MGEPFIYFDHNATTPLHPTVWQAMRPLLTDVFGNPSSLHTEGLQARDAVEEARERVAQLIGAGERRLLLRAAGQKRITSPFWAASWHGSIRPDTL